MTVSSGRPRTSSVKGSHRQRRPRAVTRVRLRVIGVLARRLTTMENVSQRPESQSESCRHQHAKCCRETVSRPTQLVSGIAQRSMHFRNRAAAAAAFGARHIGRAYLRTCPNPRPGPEPHDRFKKDEKPLVPGRITANAASLRRIVSSCCEPWSTTMGCSTAPLGILYRFLTAPCASSNLVAHGYMRSARLGSPCGVRVGGASCWTCGGGCCS